MAAFRGRRHRDLALKKVSNRVRSPGERQVRIDPEFNPRLQLVTNERAGAGFVDTIHKDRVDSVELVP